jgi:hypothetical protein
MLDVPINAKMKVNIISLSNQLENNKRIDLRKGFNLEASKCFGFVEIKSSNQSLYYGESKVLSHFSKAVSGIIFKWKNNNSRICLALTGYGDISSYVVNNITTFPVTSLNNIAPKTENNSVFPKSFKYTINIITAKILLFIQSYYGESKVLSHFSKAVSGIIFKWKNNNSRICLALTGYGDISSYVVNNITAFPVTSLNKFFPKLKITQFCLKQLNLLSIKLQQRYYYLLNLIMLNQKY